MAVLVYLVRVLKELTVLERSLLKMVLKQSNSAMYICIHWGTYVGLPINNLERTQWS